MWKEKFILFISNIKWTILLKKNKKRWLKSSMDFSMIKNLKVTDSWKIPSNSKTKGKLLFINDWISEIEKFERESCSMKWEWKKKIELSHKRCSRLVLNQSLEWSLHSIERLYFLWIDEYFLMTFCIRKEELRDLRTCSSVDLIIEMAHKSTNTFRFSDVDGQPMRPLAPLQASENEALVSLEEATEEMFMRLKRTTFRQRTV